MILLNQNIKIYKDVNKNILELKKIFLLFEKVNYIPDEEFPLFIVQNDKICELINSILSSDNYKQSIKEELLISMIEAYKILNTNIQEELTVEELINELSQEEEFVENRDTLDLLHLYISELKYPILSAEEEKELCKRIEQKDQKAKEEFINRNLRFVVSVARKYKGRGLPLLDLIQNGNIGLLNAVERFDYTKGFRFCTYATWWIKKEIVREIQNTARVIRVPVHTYEDIQKFKLVTIRLSNELFREPSLQEIASEMKISMEKANRLSKAQEDASSLNDTLTNQEGSGELIDFIPDMESLENKIISSELKMKVKQLLQNSSLKSREVEILIKKYGLDGNAPRTLKSIGSDYGITYEAVRQAKEKAIKKLRIEKSIDDFIIYADNPQQAMQLIQIEKNKKAKSNTVTTIAESKARVLTKNLEVVNH